MKLYINTNKCSPLSERLCRSGFFLIIVSYFITKVPGWISGIGFLAILAGLVVLLTEKISERKEWEAKHQTNLVNRKS